MTLKIIGKIGLIGSAYFSWLVRVITYWLVMVVLGLDVGRNPLWSNHSGTISSQSWKDDVGFTFLLHLVVETLNPRRVFPLVLLICFFLSLCYFGVS